MVCIISLFDQLTNPRAARFCDVVFDQGAGIKVIESHPESATALNENLAQRWVEGEAPHETQVVLLFLFWQGLLLSGQVV
jgi:hypothetical protein